MSNHTTSCLRSLSARLDREWAHLCRRPAVVERVRSWDLTPHPFESLGEFLVLTGYKSAPSRSADQLLGRLVGVAAAEPLAARIVLQRILPGLLAIVRAEQRREPHVDAFDLLIGEAWLSIATYRVASRPTDIAARLLHDARHRAFTSPRRRRHRHDVPSDQHTLAGKAFVEHRSSFDELTAVLRDARRNGLSDDALEVVRDLLQHGSATKVAAARRITTRTVRYRQRGAVTAIRRHIAA